MLFVNYSGGDKIINDNYVYEITYPLWEETSNVLNIK